jgi:glycosyltransferase involved in cell wall biosynthesis
MRECDVEPRHAESRKRAIDVLAMLPTLEAVELVGPVSRNQMIEEMSEAQVLAYPCDPYTWTEGFSVTTMEACAAGCVPVITDADALGEIYGEVVPMVRRYACGRMDTEGYVELVVRALNDAKWRKRVVSDTAELAKGYAWPVVAERLERMIKAA